VLRDFSSLSVVGDGEFPRTTEVAVYESKEPDRVGAIYYFHDQSVILIIAIPVSISASQLIEFLQPATIRSIQRIRLVKDAAPNRYMAIIKFIDAAAAETFKTSHQGRLFSSVDGVEASLAPAGNARCHLVTVSSIEFTTSAPLIEPLFDPSDFDAIPPVRCGLDSAEFLEIPTCPVCLERIDSAATGIMIVICQHKFHCDCLARWSDGRCPVCRFILQCSAGRKSNVGSAAGDNVRSETAGCCCTECSSADDIWICLICGNPGCGRYQLGHAYSHYTTTGHNFALEVASHRVWDYSGDRYERDLSHFPHRL
jgi:BRCA1-associated protein